MIRFRVLAIWNRVAEDLRERAVSKVGKLIAWSLPWSRWLWKWQQRPKTLWDGSAFVVKSLLLGHKWHQSASRFSQRWNSWKAEDAMKRPAHLIQALRIWAIWSCYTNSNTGFLLIPIRSSGVWSPSWWLLETGFQAYSWSASAWVKGYTVTLIVHILFQTISSKPSRWEAEIRPPLQWIILIQWGNLSPTAGWWFCRNQWPWGHNTTECTRFELCFMLTPLPSPKHYCQKEERLLHQDSRRMSDQTKAFFICVCVYTNTCVKLS